MIDNGTLDCGLLQLYLRASDGDEGAEAVVTELVRLYHAAGEPVSNVLPDNYTGDPEEVAYEQHSIWHIWQIIHEAQP